MTDTSLVSFLSQAIHIQRHTTGSSESGHDQTIHHFGAVLPDVPIQWSERNHLLCGGHFQDIRHHFRQVHLHHSVGRSSVGVYGYCLCGITSMWSSSVDLYFGHRLRRHDDRSRLLHALQEHLGSRRTQNRSGDDVDSRRMHFPLYDRVHAGFPCRPMGHDWRVVSSEGAWHRWRHDHMFCAYLRFYCR